MLINCFNKRRKHSANRTGDVADDRIVIETVIETMIETMIQTAIQTVIETVRESDKDR